MLLSLPVCVARLVYQQLEWSHCVQIGLTALVFRKSPLVVDHLVSFVDWPTAFQPTFDAVVRRLAGRCQLCLRRVRQAQATRFALKCHTRCLRPYLVPTRRLRIQPDDKIVECRHTARRADPGDLDFRRRLRGLSIPCGSFFSGWRWYSGALFWDRNAEQSVESSRLDHIIPRPKRRRIHSLQAA